MTVAAGLGAAALLTSGERICRAQAPVPVPAPGAIAAPAAAAAPLAGAATMPMQAAAPAGVAQGFAPQGGIGTTPFLGNTRGMGAYSVNYDKVRYRVGPRNRQVYTTAAPRRGLFRRWRWWR